MVKIRKGPSESATKYEIGLRKKGNDGNIWMITVTKNGVKRWTVLGTGSRKQIIKTKPKRSRSISRSAMNRNEDKEEESIVDKLNKKLYDKFFGWFRTLSNGDIMIIYKNNEE